METSKKLSLLSSIVFILALLIDILRRAVGNELAFSILTCLYWGFLLLMAIALMTNKRNIGFSIISGINVLRILYSTRSIWDNFSSYSTSGKLFNIFNILSAIALFVIFLVATKSTVGSKKTITGLWFVPALLLLVRYLPVWSTNNYSSVEKAYAILSISCQAAHLLAFLFTGLWLKSVIQEDINYYPPIHSSSTVKESIPTLGGADKLLQYKELLDSGIITQEEFSEKKKQVLGS